jgi:bacterioferritin-associated ferredoxin
MATRKRSSYARRDIKEPTRDHKRQIRKSGDVLLSDGVVKNLDKTLNKWLSERIGNKSATAAGVNFEESDVAGSSFKRKKQDPLEAHSLKAMLIRGLVTNLKRQGVLITRPVDEEMWGFVVAEKLDKSKFSKRLKKHKKATTKHVAEALSEGPVSRQDIIDFIVRECGCCVALAAMVIEDSVVQGVAESFMGPSARGGKPLRWYELSKSKAVVPDKCKKNDAY